MRRDAVSRSFLNFLQDAPIHQAEAAVKSFGFECHVVPEGTVAVAAVASPGIVLWQKGDKVGRATPGDPTRVVEGY